MTVSGQLGVGGSHTGHAGRAVRGGVPDHGRVPKYYAVKARLIALLGELGEGAALPAERDLAVEYGVSRATLRHAIAELVLEGRLRAMRGRGTFVTGPKVIQPLQLGSYTEAVRATGRRPGRRVVDDAPLGLESTYLPADRYPTLLDVFDPVESLYRCLQERLGVVFAAAEEQIETVLATPREALLLDTNPAVPMLLLHRVSYDPDGVPIERVRSLYRGDRMGFVTRLVR